MKTFSVDVDVDSGGSLRDPSQVPALLDQLFDATDVVVMAFGWSNDRAEAAALYDEFIRRMYQIVDSGLVPAMTLRRLAVVRIFWPCRKLEEAETAPGARATSARQENLAAIFRLLDDLETAASVGNGLVERAKGLAPSLEVRSSREEFVTTVRGMLNPDAVDVDDGSGEFFEAPAESLFEGLGDQESLSRADGASLFGTAAVDDADEHLTAALRIVSYANYYHLKRLADRVGRSVVGGLLLDIRDRWPGRRLHLVGHSFGARVMAAAAATLPPASPGVTLALLQPALSHDAFARKEYPGPFRRVVADARVTGPVLVIHTAHEREGSAYPQMARLMRLSQPPGVGDSLGPPGAMGRHGAQYTPEAISQRLQPLGSTYNFTARRVINLEADQFVSGPRDVAGAEVVYAFLSAAANETSALSPEPLGKPADSTVGQSPQSDRVVPRISRVVAPPPPTENPIVRVFYGTSRGRSLEEGDGVRYTSDRGEALSLGFADVSIPSVHQRGNIERPSIWRLERREDPDRHVVIVSVLEASAAEFFESLSADLVRSRTDATFVFIHGYNVRFEEAARRTAQLGYDLGIAVPAMFSWPSGGLVRDYIADGTVAEWSVPFLVSFLRDIRAHSGARTVHVIAHSMGNRVLAGALTMLRAEASAGPLFQQVVLTAPDIDAAVFEQQIAPQIRPCSAGMTLYASSADKALRVAHRLHRARRAGDAGEDVVIVNGIDTIDATKVSTGFGHSVFGDVRTVVEDISLLLRLGLPPGERNLVLRHRGTKAYWEFPA